MNFDDLRKMMASCLQKKNSVLQPFNDTSGQTLDSQIIFHFQSVEELLKTIYSLLAGKNRERFSGDVTGNLQFTRNDVCGGEMHPRTEDEEDELNRIS